MAFAEGFIRRERHYRGEPAEQAFNHGGHHRAHGAAAVSVCGGFGVPGFRGGEGRIAIERVLSDIEIDSREFDVHEVDDGGHHALEVEHLEGGAHFTVEFGEAVEDQAFEAGHVLGVDGFSGRVAVQSAEHVAQRIAEFAVGLDRALDDLVGDAGVIPIVSGGRPEAEDLDTVLFLELIRFDRVADRFRHLLAIGVNHHAVGDDMLVWRHAARGAAFQKRGLEPAAVLVGAFHVDVRLPRGIVDDAALAQSKGMRRAGIEPDVEDVGDLFPAFRRDAGAGEEICVRRGEPSVHAGSPDSGLDVRVELVGLLARQCGGVRLAFCVDEQRNRHAPVALARDQPVRPALNHGGETVAACRREELGVGDGLHREFAQRLAGMHRLVHRDKPLRRGAADDRCLGAPGVGIADRRDAAGEEVAALGEEADDFVVRLARLAALLAGRDDDVEALERFGHIVRIATIGIDDLADLLRRVAGGEPDVEVILAVRRRGVYEAGAGVVGDVITGEHRDSMLEER